MKLENFGFPESDTLTYFRTLQLNEYRRKYGWNLFENSNEPDSFPDNYLLDIKKYTSINEQNKYNDDELNNNWKLMGRLGYDIWEDIHECICEKYHDIHKNVVVGFIPIGLTNAFCLNSDFRNKLLSGNIIALNAGLFFCTELLGQSIIIENLTGELEKFRNSGRVSFDNATNLYLSPTVDNLNNRFCLNKHIDKIYISEVSLYIGALHAIILTFIALHEFGHIVSGHLDEKIGVRSFNIITGDIEYHMNEEKEKNNWKYEFQADQFAVEALCYRSKSCEIAWNNFASIYLFFKWLDNLEGICGHKCLYHPPASQRASCLYVYMKKICGEPVHDYTYWVDRKISEWSAMS